MADALDTPVSYLMGWDGIERLTAYEKRLLEAVRKADPITKQMLDRVLDLKTEIPVLPTRGNLHTTQQSKEGLRRLKNE